MAVRFEEDFEPVDNPPFLPGFNNAVHCFSNVTLDMARRLIDSAAANALNDMERVLDLRRVLDLMEWCSFLPTTGRAMPWFDISLSNSSFHLFHEMLERCHVCLKKKVPFCMCAATKRDERVPFIVFRDWKRLDLILDHHRHRCLCLEHTSTAQSLVMLECASISAWTKAINAELFQCLFRDKSVDRIPRYVNTAVAQMNAYVAIATKQPPGEGRGLSVLDRLQALDMADADEKRQLQLDLHSYLNNVYEDGDSATLSWVPQPDVLRRVLSAIETYERGMQCTLLVPQRKVDHVNMYVVATIVLLALGVAKAFQQDQQPKVNYLMYIVAVSVLLALGAAKALQQDQQGKASQSDTAMRSVVN